MTESVNTVVINHEIKNDIITQPIINEIKNDIVIEPINVEKKPVPVDEEVGGENNNNITSNPKKYMKIVGKKSKFNYDSFCKYDVPAREKVKKVLGDFVTDNPDEYGEDLIINSPSCKYKYLELQVCSSWLNEKYPFNYPYVYARKIRYADDTLFLVLNKCLTKGYIFDMMSFKNVEPRRFKKYSREYVYDIPWHRVMTVYIETLDKETIESY
ncbi:MAG: hypothetical protein Edafosvirus48_2 [Edafosvirus sp.]|uniref:Uncharacterized protein n=1 Tax=Edafosvirus sp. TaxID=2487765 RepID=A0A3G4ZY28_9VIRU|nr:MAG: hypothetical protein Edafosvirus48_2 [Edafosvirus sp.]